MKARNTTEAFLNSLKNSYFHNTASVSTEYLRGECRMLSFLNIDPKKSYQPGDLSRILNITTARTASTLKSLQRKNLIKREVCKDDKRKIFVSITDEGICYIENKREDVCLFFDEIFEKLEPSECAEFVRIITKMSEIGEQNSKK